MSTRDFTLSWTIDAPRSEVFRAWTDPTELEWFYNDSMPIPDEPIELDLRVGGVWRQKMVIDDETSYFTGGVYREIVPDERLVFSWGATDGWPPLGDDCAVVTVTLDDADDGGTQMSLHVQLPETISHPHLRDGWRETVDRLQRAMNSSRLPNGSAA